MPYLFAPPTQSLPAGRDRLWSRFHYQSGLALIKSGGFYSQPADVVADEDIAAGDATYLGGHVYLVSDSEAADLTAAGYGAYLSIPPASTGYGQGRFGAGAYGEGDTSASVAGVAAGGAYGEGAYGDGIYKG